MFDFEYWGHGTFPMGTNMSIEEYLLVRSAASKKATVRFWEVPKDSVVLGYAQALDVVKKWDDTPVVRRMTGGSHIQFGPNCIAYSFTTPRDGTFKTHGDMRAYFAEKVSAAMENLGVPDLDVDNRASTINVRGKVVASHAILWGVESAIIHGLAVIDPYNVDRIFERLYLGERKIGKKTYTEYSALKNIPAVSEILQKSFDPKFRTQLVKSALAKEILQEVTGGKHTNMSWSDRNRSDIGNFSRNKYGEAWVQSRNPPFTEEEVEEIPGEELAGPLKSGLGYCLYSQVSDKDFKRMAESNEK